MKLSHVLTNMAKSQQISNEDKLLKEIFDQCYNSLLENTPSFDSNSISPYLSSLLTFLYQAASSSLDREKYCIFALFQIVKIKNVKTDLISKVRNA